MYNESVYNAARCIGLGAMFDNGSGKEIISVCMIIFVLLSKYTPSMSVFIISSFNVSFIKAFKSVVSSVHTNTMISNVVVSELVSEILDFQNYGQLRGVYNE